MSLLGNLLGHFGLGRLVGLLGLGCPGCLGCLGRWLQSTGRTGSAGSLFGLRLGLDDLLGLLVLELVFTIQLRLGYVLGIDVLVALLALPAILLGCTRGTPLLTHFKCQRFEPSRWIFALCSSDFLSLGRLALALALLLLFAVAAPLAFAVALAFASGIGEDAPIMTTVSCESGSSGGVSAAFGTSGGGSAVFARYLTSGLLLLRHLSVISFHFCFCSSESFSQGDPGERVGVRSAGPGISQASRCWESHRSVKGSSMSPWEMSSPGRSSGLEGDALLLAALSFVLLRNGGRGGDGGSVLEGKGVPDSLRQSP